MKSIVSIEKKEDVKHKEQRWVQFEVQYESNNKFSVCWVPIEYSIFEKLSKKKVEEHILKTINKSRD